MKKILVVALALMMALSMLAVASAETRTYMMTTVLDADGNLLCTVTDDFSAAVDAEGNDVTDSYPILVFECDDEAMTGTWGTETDLAACTLTEEEEADGTIAFTATFEDGSSMLLVYDTEADMFGFTDDNGYIYTMADITEA